MRAVRLKQGSIRCRVNAAFRCPVEPGAFGCRPERRVYAAATRLSRGWSGLGLLILAMGCLVLPFNLHAQTNSVGPVPDALRGELKLDPFYQKYLAVGPLPIFSSTHASDFALREAAYIVRHMLSLRPEIIQVLATNGVKIVVMAYDEYTTDLPEQRHMQPPVYWDSRARGLGGRTCSGAEENLLCYPGDPYAAENIFIHEFGHVIHGTAMKALDPTFDGRLRAAYASATNHGLWKGTYAGTGPGEYWAESVQDWFDNNRFNDALQSARAILACTIWTAP